MANVFVIVTVGMLFGRWNMLRKPTGPDLEVRHERSITGLHSIGEHIFVSCAMDGRLCVWDMRNGRRPVSTMHAPDNR